MKKLVLVIFLAAVAYVGYARHQSPTDQFPQGAMASNDEGV